MPATSSNIALLIFEGILLLGGLVLIWRQVGRPAGRAAWRSPAPLAPWVVPPTDFLLFVFLIAVGGLLAQFVAALILGSLHLAADTRAILANTAFQFGLLLSVALLPRGTQRSGAGWRDLRGTVATGAATFLIALPVVTGVNLLWLGLLKFCGLPAEEQELLRLFEHTESKALLALLIGLAVIVAPIAEELIFRGTIFRYLRTRWPHWLALLVPGAIFAALHVNWRTLDGFASFAPLVALAIILALAYERTGRIGTAVVAHALFNLHSVVLLFAGVTT